MPGMRSCGLPGVASSWYAKPLRATSMRFTEAFASSKGPIISFEVFPPKTEKGMEQLHEVLPRLVALRPDFMTVTYGAMGTTQARTLDIAALIQRRFGIATASHLTCVGASQEEINGILDRLSDSGIENIVALRGDPPVGQAKFTPPPGGFRYAKELVAHVRKTGRFGIAVAGYPEKHLEAPDMEADLQNLKRKVAAGGDVVVTQLFYDNADFYRFEARLRVLGVTVPIVPGLLPIQSFAQIKKITSLCGAKIPRDLLEQIERTDSDEKATQEIGARWAVEQCRDLLGHGVRGIHFYVLNKAAQMESILAQVGRIPVARTGR